MNIGIIFNDNDFVPTFEAIMEFFSKLEEIPRSKSQICKIVNEIVLGFYLAYQNKFRYRNSEEELEKARKYLQIGEENILLDEEVSKYCEDNQWWDNSETILLIEGQIHII